MSPHQRRERLAAARLYLCMDRRAERGDLDRFLDQVLAAGVDLVQLRDKTATEFQLREAAPLFRAAADRHEALFILNDDAHLAAELGADGVHVGQDDLHPDAARAIVGVDAIVGWSTHSVDEVDAAVAADCDYFAVGPVSETPTKPGRPGIGVGALRHAVEVAGDKPWFVTGGMSPETAPAVLDLGARRLVVVRALTEAADAGAVAARMRALLDRQG